MIHQFEQFGIFAEEMFTRVAAGLHDIFLIVAVHALLHALDQQPRLIAPNDFIPVTAPNDLDDTPARAAEKPFEFLNDFPVAARSEEHTSELQSLRHLV